MLVQLLTIKKVSFFNSEITENAGNQKELFGLFKRLINKSKGVIYPESLGDQELANEFSVFFHEKIQKINDTFPRKNDENESRFPTKESECTAIFNAFPKLDTEDVREYIQASPTKSCSLDPVPTFLLKKCLDTVLPTITAIKSFTNRFNKDMFRNL